MTINRSKLPKEEQQPARQHDQEENTERTGVNTTNDININKVRKTSNLAKLQKEEQQLAKEHDQEEKANKAGSNATIATLIVQCGRPRTATTDQAMALCAAANLATSTPTEVLCQNLKKMHLSYRKLKSLPVSELWPPGWPPRSDHPGTAGQLMIYKTHDLERCRLMIETAAAAGPPEELGWRFLAFGSVNNKVDKNPLMVAFKMKSYFAEGFPYMQYTVQNRYKPLLNLSPTDTVELLEYLKVFVVLRRCCGHQMSRGFSEELNGLHKLHTQNATSVSDMHTQNITVSDALKMHACYKVDVVAVEQQLLSLPIVQRYSQLRHLQFSSGPGGKLELDGLQCVRHRWLASLGVGFNYEGWKRADPGARSADDAYYRVNIDEALASMAWYRLLVGLPPDPRLASQL